MDIRRRLHEARDPQRLERLGFRPDDARDAHAMVDALVGTPERVAELAERLVRGIGAPVPRAGEAYAAFDGVLGPDHGIEALAALLVTVDDVRAHHRCLGVDDEVSWATLADLGQQVWVHRQTYGAFGLHTQGWLATAWAGHLFALGRLQFTLHRVPADPHRGTLVLSTHIPQTGPLEPAATHASLTSARPFFAARFPEVEPAWLHCMSWLLDPQLAEALPGSNIATFQRRWELFGNPEPGMADAVFFTFHRRGVLEPGEDGTYASLPQGSRLERFVAERVRTGRALQVRHGRLAFDDR